MMQCLRIAPKRAQVAGWHPPDAYRPLLMSIGTLSGDALPKTLVAIEATGDQSYASKPKWKSRLQ
jgi:hypothetical protein